MSKVENKRPVDYTVRDRSFEKNMIRQNVEHLGWQDRLRKEREAYNA